MPDNSTEKTRLLTSMADIMFVPMLFHILTQWDKLTTWPARFLWFGLLLLVKNELITVKDSYRCYSLVLYVLDFFSLLIFLFSVQALTKVVPPYGYNPHFWYFLAALWFFYAVWDIVMFNKETEAAQKNRLKMWTIYMCIASTFTLISAILLGQIDNDLTSNTNNIIFYSAQVVPGLFIVYAVVCWLMTVKAKFSPPSVSGTCTT